MHKSGSDAVDGSSPGTVLAYNLTRVMNIMGISADDGRNPSIVKAGQEQLASPPRVVPGLCGKAF